MTDLPKAYTPHDVEGAIYERWLAADVFAPDGAGSTADPDLPPFTIIQPPPNITGSLHLGHAQRTAVEDLMIRHARMRGHRALFLPGLDHAGDRRPVRLRRHPREGRGEPADHSGASATSSGCAHSSPRPARSCSASNGGSAASADWGRLRYTMDDGSAKAVRVAFERLYRADLAYRTEALVNWCPGCRTSVSDLEVIATPETGTLWSVRYHLIDAATGVPTPDATITIATTRPETILGDTAVAVHPDDPRYQALVGRMVRIPFVERDVPIIADAVVDPAFGTGAVKITPAHDHDDHETGLRHGLPAMTILADDATITGTGTRYDGMDRFEARAAIVADLEARGDLVGRGATRDGHRALPAQQRHHRAAAQDPVVHPDDAARATGARGDPQRPDADPPRALREDLGALADQHPRLERLAPAVVGPSHPGLVLPRWPRDRVCRARPARMPAPCAAGPPPSCSRTPTSSIPGSARACGRSRRSAGRTTRPTLATYYPTSVMETGYDIIFFWVARMMMLGLQLTEREPFHTVYLSGLIRDPLRPEDVEDEGQRRRPARRHRRGGRRCAPFRAHPRRDAGQRPALRAGQARARPQLREQALERDALRASARGRPRSPRAPSAASPMPGHLGPAERWLLSRAAATTEAVDAAMADYAFGEVTRLVYEAIWNEYCDWGLEFAKVRLADENSAAEAREATWWTLVEVLDTYLRLLHPVMPFVTEALWASLPHRATDPELLIVARWPGVGERRPGRRDERSRCSSTSSARSATRAHRPSSRPPTGSRRSCTCRSSSVRPSRRSSRRSSDSPAPGRSIAS